MNRGKGPEHKGVPVLGGPVARGGQGVETHSDSSAFDGGVLRV